ncbi:MAG: Pili assembly chaperone, N-terminal [Novosphingobium sp.]|nr:Pili assembly chaperone, N-terminal [Novosphingobium sp.]
MTARSLNHVLLTLAACLAPMAGAGSAQASVVIDATRVIYPADRREVSVTLHNAGLAPALVQVWTDLGDPQSKPGEVKTPFILTPPLFRVDPAKGQTLRLIYSQEPLATDRESVFWLNVLDIPPRTAAAPDRPNLLELAFRHRLKILFRPQGLAGNAADAAAAVSWRIVRTNGHAVIEAHNPTPYFVSYTAAEVKSGGVAATAETAMLSPFTTGQFALSKADFRAADTVSVQYGFVNDFGTEVHGTARANLAPD